MFDGAFSNSRLSFPSPTEYTIHAPGTRRPRSCFPRCGFGRGATLRLGRGSLCKERAPHSDARRDAALHGGLPAPGHVAAVPDHDHAHAVQRWTLWANRVPTIARTVACVHERRVHLRLPGRARAVHVGWR